MILASCLPSAHPGVQPLVVVFVALHDGGTKEYAVRGSEASLSGRGDEAGTQDNVQGQGGFSNGLTLQLTPSSGCKPDR